MIIHLRDGSSVELEDGSSALDLARHLKRTGPGEALAAEVNGKNRDLTVQLQDGDTVVLWDFDDPEGKEIFWHTSAHVLAQAVLRIWPDAQPTIGPPIDQGFYYDFANLHISEEDFPKIEKEMKAICSENLRCEREKFDSKAEALQHFGDNPYKTEMSPKVFMELIKVILI